MQKIHFDAVHVKEGKFPYLIVGRDDLPGWVEAEPLRRITAKATSVFIERDFLSRFGWLAQATVDSGSEFRRECRELLEKAGVRVVVSAPYHPEANGRVERGHGPLMDAIAKVVDKPANWHCHLSAALLADRISVQRTTGYSAYELLYGVAPVLPIDLSEETWVISEWDKVRTREDLLARRIRQIERKEEDVSLAKRKM